MRITLKYICLAAAILQVGYSFPWYNFEDEMFEDLFEDSVEIDDDSGSDSSDDQNILVISPDYLFNVFGVSSSEDDIDEFVNAFLGAFTIDFGLFDFLVTSSEEIDSTETQLEKPPLFPTIATNEESNSTINSTSQNANPNFLENHTPPSDQELPVVGLLPIPQFMPNNESNSTILTSLNAKPTSSENQMPSLNQGNNLQEPSPTPATITEPIPLSVPTNPPLPIGTDSNNTLILSLPSDQVNDVDGEGVSESTEKSNN